MARLLVIVEGHTEEKFVNEVLRTHLSNHGYTSIGARLMGDPRSRRNRGGIQSWLRVREEILRHLKSNQSVILTTMVDYYGLPELGKGAWPGRAKAKNAAFENKAEIVQQSILSDITDEMGERFYIRRFIPFVIMHEFEGLLFSDCKLFAEAIERPTLAGKFQAIRDKFLTPEEINDSPTTAPSKRVQKLIPEYQKVLHGKQAITKIGLDKIRAECSNFRQWIDSLEDMAKLSMQ